ncbi:DEKNAAC100952 [Brettanomyces naardenensis]|uniref:DEKNAAC100952 n=1 Tax=Brettanomyces naardenensis TaxID=13370 RepID=A0A448YGZ8_BRENA|nr:DEKNAAC100952 [Brettanomyces naardenensis]
MEASTISDHNPDHSDSETVVSGYLLPGATNSRKKRVGKACDSCRLKKTKCSGIQPCEKCIADNKICTYSERSNKSTDKVYSYDYVEMMEKRLCILRKALLKLCEIVSDDDDKELRGFRSGLDNDTSVNHVVSLLLTKKEMERDVNERIEFLTRIEAAEELALKLRNRTEEKPAKVKRRRSRKPRKVKTEEKEDSAEAIQTSSGSPSPTSVPYEGGSLFSPPLNRINENREVRGGEELREPREFDQAEAVQPENSVLEGTDLQPAEEDLQELQQLQEPTDPLQQEEVPTALALDPLPSDNDLPMVDFDTLDLSPFNSGAQLATAAMNGYFPRTNSASITSADSSSTASSAFTLNDINQFAYGAATLRQASPSSSISISDPSIIMMKEPQFDNVANTVASKRHGSFHGHSHHSYSRHPRPYIINPDRASSHSIESELTAVVDGEFNML